MCRRGFTLIELLVATSMMAMLAAGGFAALSAGTRAADKARRHGAMMVHGQAALRAITADIRGAVEHGNYWLLSLDNEYEGLPADTLDFVVAGRPQIETDDPEAGWRCEVGYSIDNDPDTESQWLLRREDCSLDEDALEGGIMTLAGPRVASLDLEFYDGFFWQAGWSERELFPDAISIRLVVLDEDEIESPKTFAATVRIMAQ